MERARSLIAREWVRLPMLALAAYVFLLAPPSISAHFFVRLAGTMGLLTAVLGPHRMGVINSWILLSLVYLVAIGPMRIVAALTGDDALGRRAAAPTLWKPKRETEPASTRIRARFQF